MSRLPGRGPRLARRPSHQALGSFRYYLPSFSSSTSSSLSSAPDAQHTSNLIDEEIKRDAVRRQGERLREVKVVLLGQAESGKSTLQKQLQLYHASHILDAERPAWRIVVYANLIKAVRMIFEELDFEFSAAAEEYPLPSDGSGPTDVAAQNELNVLRRKLLPLISLESSLSSELSEDVAFTPNRHGTLLLSPKGRRSSSRPISALRDSSRAVLATNRVAQVLSELGTLLELLWHHRTVQYMIRVRKLRLEESGHFFLQEISRVSQSDYCPTIDDVLHVRLQTVGVIEHVLRVGRSNIWKIYDVGGTRAQRPAWSAYFDDVNALAILVPISAFDQYLEEDPLTNRIHDSLELVTAICANKLLKNAQLVLLLNKIDLLRRKLESGLQIRDYIISYGNRPNNFSAAADYFRSHFLTAHKRKDPFNRSLYVHLTSLVDVQASQIIIASVQDVIMRKHIAQSGLT